MEKIHNQDMSTKLFEVGTKLRFSFETNVYTLHKLFLPAYDI